MANARAEAEYAYGYKLKDIPSNLAVKKDGFGADDGASLRKSFEGIITEMGEEGNHHVVVAENIRKMVIQPFRKWADEHKQRVDFSYNFLRTQVDNYSKKGTEAQKSQSQYFNKCRVYDIARREDEVEKMQEEVRAATESHIPSAADPSNPASTTHDSAATPSSPDPQHQSLETEPSTTNGHTNNHEDDDYEEVTLGGFEYNNSELKLLLSQMLHEIPQNDVKIPIIGTYDHVSTGSDIVVWLTKNPTAGSVAVAEKFGQDLIQNGFLRLVGQVGSKFLNSSVQKYQWKKLAFVRAGLAEPTVERKGTDLISSMAGEYLPDSISSSISNYLNNPNPNETQVEKLEREVKELDKKCYEAVTRYDDARMLLEEMIVRHFNFMQRCETDRLKAIKVVMLDFTAAISNKVVGLKSTIDKYLLYQESIVPERDLRYLVELYKTGTFSPQAPCYDNYYAPSKGWTFGGDLEVRARGDGKRIPLLISSILRYLDNEYPSLENDEERLGIWTAAVSLEDTHKLRKEINNGEPIPKDVFKKYSPQIIVSAFKLYFLELPDSLVPSKCYELVKNIYSEKPTGSNGSSSTFVQSDQERIKNIQCILKECNISSVMIVDAIAKHLERLMEIAKPEEEYKVKLAHELGPLILRPKQQNSTTMDDRHPYLFFRDILENRKAIFDELRRQSSSSSRKSSIMGMQNPRLKKNSGINANQHRSASSSSGIVPAVSNLANEEISGLSRQDSFVAGEAESKDFHATPIASKRLVQTIASDNKRDSIEITAVNENVNGAASGFGKEASLPDSTSPEAAKSGTEHESLESSAPGAAKVIEVDDD